MACGKPAGDPSAIMRAADAISEYAAGAEQMFGTAPAEIARVWTGSSADGALAQIGEYQSQADSYADQLRAYADQLRQYAVELEKMQSCTVWDILTWVFLVVFAIVELVIGLFCGGLIEGFLAGLFEAVLGAALGTLMTVGEVIGDAVEGSVLFGRIVGNIVDAAADLATDFGAVGDEIGSVILGAGTVFDPLATDLEIGGDALVSSDLVVTTESTVDVVAERFLTFLSDLPRTALEKSTGYVKNLVQNTAEGFFQELVIRGVTSLNPKSGGFSKMWSSADGETALAIVIGLIGGGLGASLSLQFVGQAERLLAESGLGFGAKLASVPRIGDLGGILAEESAISIPREVFNDVMTNVWISAVIGVVNPALSGDDFSWKDFWWFVSYGIVSGVLVAPLRGGARAITDRYVGEVFPDSVAALKKDSPLLSEAAKGLGDTLIGEGLTIFRKVAFDPTVQLGSFYASQAG
jgi:hypothetical protein